MEKDTKAAREDALAFLMRNEAGVLATLAGNGDPHARLLYYTCDDSFNVYFITLNSTRKVADLARDPRAAFVVSEMDVPRTLQMEGTVEDLTETATNDSLLVDFVHRLMNGKKFGVPLSHFDASVLKFYRLKPTWIRWGDFTFGEGTDEVLTEINPE